MLLSLLAGCAGSTPEITAKAGDEVTIYLVRHGKTWFNTINLIQGFADAPLTKVGIEQVEIVGHNMSDTKFVTAYSSSLGRQKSALKLILDANNNAIPAIFELNGLKE